MLFNKGSLKCEGLCEVILALGVEQPGNELRGIRALCKSGIASSSYARPEALAYLIELVLLFIQNDWKTPVCFGDAKRANN